MKVSELWLRTLINPTMPIEKIGEHITFAGVEVDSTDTIELLFPEETSEKRIKEDHSNKEKQSNSTSPQDMVLTLKTPANRGDCLSMEGIAREVSALTKLPYHAVQFKVSVPKIVDLFPIHVEAQQACPRYLGRIIQNINSKAQTPHWMQNRLHSAGIRSISPVVDVTNYVMLEMGQPLHAFDLTELDSEIVVRFAKQGEKITTLDGNEIELRNDTLIIADKQKPQAIAGIIGGNDSAVTESTQNIFLECAYFDPINIRFSARQFGLRTDSSIRFERGVDPNLQTRAIERATQLLEKIVGGNVGPIIDKTDARALPISPTIALRREKLSKLLGALISDNDIKDILDRLEMSYVPQDYGFEITIPSFRVDIDREEDLIEEILRIYGLNRIPSIVPVAQLNFCAIPENKLSPARIKQTLSSRGYLEAITYSFVSKELVELLSLRQPCLELANPISSDMSVMRNSLWPGLIQTLLHNKNRQQDRIRLFEMGACFIRHNNHNNRNNKTRDNKENVNETWEERNMLGGICSGPVNNEQWGVKQRTNDFYDVKADIESLLELTKHPLEFDFRPLESSVLHPGQSAEIWLRDPDKSDEPIGVLAALHPRIVKGLDLPNQDTVIVFELELDRLLAKTRPKFQEFSKYPAIRRDIAVIVGKDVLAEDLKSAIVKVAGPLLREVILFDVYQGKGIDPASKSVALGLILQDTSRTLIEDQVNDVVEKVLKSLKQEYHAILRE